MYDLIHANVLDWCERYDGPPFHALLCDPPYELGFMGRDWDATGISFRKETWAALASHLHPGAFGMAFASSRGWHRMAVAIEDAGLTIHSSVFLWNFASGFPKATNPADQYVARQLRAWLAAHPDEAAELRAARLAIQQAPAGETAAARAAYQKTKLRLQQAAGLTRVIGQRRHAPKFDVSRSVPDGKNTGYNSREREFFDVVEYLDPVAAAWAGHRYGGQALKPACEPVIVFQKPYAGAAVDSIVATGAGALNIDGGRIGTEEISQHGRTQDTFGGTGFTSPEVAGRRWVGRWPANFALAHLPTCNGTCAPGCAVAALGAQSGVSKSTPYRAPGGKRMARVTYAQDAYTREMGRTEYHGPDDTGTAARYVYNADWVAEQIEQADAVGYYPKASTAEREAGLDPLQVALIRQLYADDADLPDFDAMAVGDGRETPIDNAYQRGETMRRNTHATIKPLSLTRWLATLLLPPSLYAPDRRLLVPFAGVASELIGGMLAGWDQVLGIELEESHVAIGRARMRYWQQQRHRFSGGAGIAIHTPRAAANAQQASLFDTEA